MPRPSALQRLDWPLLLIGEIHTRFHCATNTARREKVHISWCWGDRLGSHRLSGFDTEQVAKYSSNLPNPGSVDGARVPLRCTLVVLTVSFTGVSADHLACIANAADVLVRAQEFRRKEVTMRRNKIVESLIALFFLASVTAFGAAGDKAEANGMITSRTGETLLVKTAQGSVTVVLTDNTTTKDNRGLFGLDKQKMSDVVLIPGLKVEVDGSSDDQGRVIASTITVDGDDLETAEMIQAGLHPTAEQVAANMQAIETNRQNIAAQHAYLAAHGAKIDQNNAATQQQISENMKDIEETTNRFTALADYDVKDTANVRFKVGSSGITEEDKAGLQKLAQTALGLTGYIIEVTGYADSTGSAEMNTKLSEDRAKAVIAYLMQQGGVPVRHIVAPGAMGEYGQAASNETKAGRAENRRVEVKVLVNKGIAGS
jgi:outer membrane protein OmpA-like peptidoglycan-associated protein